MPFRYMPKRLKMAREEITLVHRNTSDPSEIKNNDELRRLIVSLAALEKYQVKPRANALTRKEMDMVAWYIPHNHYNVDMKNLFRIFSIRSTDRLCEILFEQWLDSYQNLSCNSFLRNALVYDEHLIISIQKHNMTEELFDSVLQDQDIAVRFGKELGKISSDMAKSFPDKMKYFGIRDDSRLFKDCEFLFYTYCGKYDYLAISKIALLELVKQYNKRSQDTLRIFLKNYLFQLELKELLDFKLIADFLRSITGDNSDSPKFKSFFKEFDAVLLRKYINWINLYKVEEYFGNDERSRFWKQYRFESVRRFSYSNAVVMEFEKYYAVEFLGQAMGPIYIYKKEYFEKQLISQFSRCDNQQMRQTLYQGGRGKWFYRKVHQGYWQGDVHAILINYDITERLDI